MLCFTFLVQIFLDLFVRPRDFIKIDRLLLAAAGTKGLTSSHMWYMSIPKIDTWATPPLTRSRCVRRSILVHRTRVWIAEQIICRTAAQREAESTLQQGCWHQYRKLQTHSSFTSILILYVFVLCLFVSVMILYFTRTVNKHTTPIGLQNTQHMESLAKVSWNLIRQRGFSKDCVRLTSIDNYNFTPKDLQNTEHMQVSLKSRPGVSWNLVRQHWSS